MTPSSPIPAFLPDFSIAGASFLLTNREASAGHVSIMTESTDARNGKPYDSLNEFPGSASTAFGEKTGRSEFSCISPTSDGCHLSHRQSPPISDSAVGNPDAWELRRMQEKLPELRLFDVIKEVGRGAFSAVFVAGVKNHPDVKVALKKIKQTSLITNAVNETRFLQRFKGLENLPELLCCVHHENSVVLVMPYLETTDFNACIQDFRVEELQSYLRQLFKALSHIHRLGIIHRDVKPGNFMFNRREGRCMLIDFGLAQYEKGSNSLFESSTSSDEGEEKCFGRPPMSTPLRELVIPQRNSRSPDAQLDDVDEDEWAPKLSRRRVTFSPNDENDRNKPANVVNNPDEGKLKEKRDERRKDERRKHSSRSEVRGKRVFGPTLEKFCRKNLAVFERWRWEKPRTAYLSRFSYSKSARNEHLPKSEAYLFLDGENCPCLGEGWMCEVCEEQAEMRAPRGGTPGFRAPEVLLKSLNQTTAIDIWSAGIMLLAVLSKQYPFFTACDDAESLVEVAGVFGTQNIVDLGAKHCGKVVTFDSTPSPCPPLELRGLSLTFRRVEDVSFSEEEKQCNFCQVAVVVSGAPHPRCLCEPDWKRRRLAAESRATSYHKHRLLGKKKDARDSVDPVRSSFDSFPDSCYDLLTKLLRVDPTARLTAEQALEHPFLKLPEC